MRQWHLGSGLFGTERSSLGQKLTMSNQFPLESSYFSWGRWVYSLDSSGHEWLVSWVLGEIGIVLFCLQWSMNFDWVSRSIWTKVTLSGSWVETSRLRARELTSPDMGRLLRFALLRPHHLFGHWLRPSDVGKFNAMAKKVISETNNCKIYQKRILTLKIRSN